MSQHKRYNAFNPLATPKEVLDFVLAPFRALSDFSDRLLEIENALRDMRAEQNYLEAVGRKSPVR